MRGLGPLWSVLQVENKVRLMRERFFRPRLRFKSYDELSVWLMDKYSPTDRLRGGRVVTSYAEGPPITAVNFIASMSSRSDLRRTQWLGIRFTSFHPALLLNLAPLTS